MAAAFGTPGKRPQPAPFLRVATTKRSRVAIAVDGSTRQWGELLRERRRYLPVPTFILNGWFADWCWDLILFGVDQSRLSGETDVFSDRSGGNASRNRHRFAVDEPEAERHRRLEQRVGEHRACGDHWLSA